MSQRSLWSGFLQFYLDLWSQSLGSSEQGLAGAESIGGSGLLVVELKGSRVSAPSC